MKNLKKIIAIALAIMTVGAFCACGQTEEPSSANTGMANPITEVASADDLAKATNVPIDAPEGAENVAYSYITVEGANPIGQVSFTLDGKDYNYRAQAVGNTDILETPDGDKADEPTTFAPEKTIGGQLSGMNYEWKAGATTMVSNRNAVIGFNDGKEGFIAWLDVVPGVLYSLSMDKGASQELLQSTAEKIFVPVQGED